MKKELRRSKSTTALVVFALLVMGYYLAVVQPGLAERTLSYIAYPLLVFNAYVIEPFKRGLEHRRAVTELEALLVYHRKEHERLVADNIALQGQLFTWSHLKEMVDFRKRYATDHAFFTQVLYKHYSDREQFFYVDMGAKHGISVDMVAVYTNCLVGRVTHVYDYYSKVMLITDARSKVPIMCAKTGSQAILEGHNLLTELTLSFASHLEKFNVGDVLLTAGEGIVFPRGFGVGSVAFVETQELTPCVRVAPLLDLQQISYCYLVQKGAEFQQPQQPTS